MRFGTRHEWGRLREVVIGLSAAEDLVVFHEESMRWQQPPEAAFSRKHAGRRLIEIDADRAHRIENQMDALAALVVREGVIVHRPELLQGDERTFLAPNGEGTQVFPRDGMIVIGEHLIEASLRLRCRQRERYGLRPLNRRLAAERGAHWSSVPPASPAGVDGPFLEGGDTLLNGHEVYVGMSGCSSDMAGIDWLQALLGPGHRVVPVALRSSVQHLDGVLALVRPGLLLWCPSLLIDGLPTALRGWDKIEISVDEAARMAAQILILDDSRAIVDSDNVRVTGELERRGMAVLPIAFDGPIRLGAGLRSAHLALWRE